VLSVGQLGVASADYYLRAVARSTVDYYTGHGEAPGYWLGEGSARLGLHGEVTAEALRHLVYGHHPASGAPLAENAGKAGRRPGFDVTFSAPKSASLLYALGDEQTRAAIRTAHDAAVADALDYLERAACKVRRGRNGVRTYDGAGFVAAAFRQRTSRAGDPQLHTQVVTANMTAGPDGRWTALDGRLVYLHAKTAGTLYQAALRDQLVRSLGVRWHVRANGLAEIAGFPAGLLRRFSVRRGQIAERMAERGETSANAARVAALATRDRKDTVPDFATLLPRWRAIADDAGFDHRAIRRLFDRARTVPARESVVVVLRADLLGPDGLTRGRASFTRLDVLRAVAVALPDGAPVAEIERMTADVLRSRDVVPLLPLARTDAAGGLARDQTVRVGEGRAGGAPLAALPRYTTVELLAAETATLARADSGRNARVGVAAPAAVDAALARRPSLSGEQRAMVRAITTSGAGVDVVVGRAGSGKTYALDAAREAWQLSGYTVIGAALSARAAAELQAHSAIPSVTLTRLLGELDRAGGLPPGVVVVVDEAGMVGTRDFDALTRYTAAAGAKLVPVGDPHQLPEIDAGGIFRALIARHGAAELLTNRRQHDPWERVGLDELRHGDVTAAIEAFDQAGSLVVGDTDEQTRDLLVAGWWRARQRWEQIEPADPQRRLLPMMRAYRRADVADFNARARDLMAANGRLSGPEVVAVNGRRFAVGDAITFTKNRYKLDLLNGDVGQVVAVDTRDRALVVRLDRGQVRVPADYLDAGHVAHGYARTIHASQGETGYTSHVYADDTLLRELGYTALSRSRHRNTLYLTVPADHAASGDPYAALRRTLERSGAQTAATDQLAPTEPPARLDLTRHSDAQLRALIAAGEHASKDQPPDVRGRIANLKSERDWLARHLQADRDRRDKLLDRRDRLGPFNRTARRDLDQRIADLDMTIARGAARVQDLDEQIGDLTHGHTRRLTWEHATRAQREPALLARDELDRRTQRDRERDERANRERGYGRDL
jgi:conjugative relaxase-like TrwC/TraI family protein